MAYLLLWLFAGTLAALLVTAGTLHLLPRIGGAAITAALARAPGLDLLVFWLTMGPWVAALVVAGVNNMSLLVTLTCLATVILAQYVALTVWIRLHQLAHREVMRGPTLAKSLNRAVGSWRNYAAVYWTALAVPVFNIVRIAEYAVYPVLIALIGLPRYNQAEWVNVSRHKFEGLVGGDRIWCLYCDWMTGIWSLGSEMLRNIESFWCPIRFGGQAKCDNCQIDFPDVTSTWVPADASVVEVAALLDEKYPGPNGVNAWFGHPVRLTVRGAAPDAPSEA